MTDPGPAPLMIEEGNLSVAWARVFLRLTDRGVDEITPLVVSITGFGEDGQPQESSDIRLAVDHALEGLGKRDTENVAFTIFPQKYWAFTKGDREAFFELYRDSFVRIQDFNPKNNKRGSYFQRLVDYEGGGKGTNQLKWILDEYARNPSTRVSKWQATTFDPTRDVTESAQLEFPCLQQVSFTMVEGGGLAMHAFYATQQILRKGYGNYLGLARLGAFMADQMGLRFVRLNVFVGRAQLDTNAGKTSVAVQQLKAIVEKSLGQADEAEAA